MKARHTMSIDEANELLSGGSAPAVKFSEIGDKISGKILTAERTQQTDFTTGQPKFWDDGKPMWQIVVTLATDERDDDIEDDDGTRRVFVRGHMLKAVQAAVRESGRKLEIGGQLRIKHTGLGDPPKKGFHPPKLFEARYEPPEIDLDGF